MGWLRRRRGSDEPTLQQLRDWHLLLVPPEVGPEQLDALIRCRVPQSALARDGRTALGRRSAISGPHLIEADERAYAKVPEPWSVGYALEVDAERDRAAMDDIGDPDLHAWWQAAFPDGKPYREEGDAVDLALALGRRLGGALRVGGSSVLLKPDHGRVSDLTVWSGYWIDPHPLLDLMMTVLPGAELELGPGIHEAPRHHRGAHAMPHSTGVEDAIGDPDHQLIDAVAREHDARALEGDVVLDGYAIAADGHLVVEVIQEEAVPPWVRAKVGHQLLSADNPVVTYTVRWQPEDIGSIESENPPYAFRLERDRIRPRMNAATLALVEATAGVVSDAFGFEVDRYTL